MTTIDAPGASLPVDATATAQRLAALYALAALQASARSPADLLQGAARIAARGSGCAFGAIVVPRADAEATVYTIDAERDRFTALQGLGGDSPATIAIRERRAVLGSTGESGGLVAVPMHSGDAVVAALIVADAEKGTSEIDVEFLQAVASLMADVTLSPRKENEAVAAGPPEADIGALLESMIDPVALISSDGTLRMSNTAYRELLQDAGLLEGPISAYPDAVMPRDRSGKAIKRSERALARAVAGHRTRSERVLRMADGHDRVFHLSTYPVHGIGGAIDGIAAVWREVTEQIARERALRLMEEVRRGLSLSGDLRRAARSVCRRAVALLSWVDMAAVYALDGEEPMLQAQAGFPVRASRLLASLSMGPSHLATVAARENRATIFHTDQDKPANESSRRFVAASGAATFLNLPLVAGRQRFGLLVLASREPHAPSREELALLEVMAAQVGAELEGVRRREEAETERARLQAVLDQLPEGVLLFDAGGRLVMSNRSSEEILGQAADTSTPVFSLATRFGFVHADGRPYHHGDDPLARAFSSGQPVLGEEQLVRRGDGRELPVVSNVAPVRDTSGQLAAVIMVFQDISSLREMDRLKDDFLSIAGHELRTPITMIRGLAQLVERRRHRLDEATISAALATISEQTDQMARLVDELQDISRIRTGRLALKFASFDLGALLRTTTERAQLQRSGPIRLQAFEKLDVVADRGRLQQVFSNLLDNAVKYSEPRTAIDVVAVSTSKHITVSVHDSGLGVPPEALGRIFERFYRAENATQHAGGLGLGLYLCREIVERHRGTIAVASSAAVGTVFTVTLPRSVRPGADD